MLAGCGSDDLLGIGGVEGLLGFSLGVGGEVGGVVGR